MPFFFLKVYSCRNCRRCPQNQAPLNHLRCFMNGLCLFSAYCLIGWPSILHIDFHKPVLLCARFQLEHGFFFFLSLSWAPSTVSHACREAAYINRSECGVGAGGSQLLTTVGVGGPVVSKTAKDFFFFLHKYHKLSQTLSQGHTSTKILRMDFSEELCKWTNQWGWGFDGCGICLREHALHP